MKRIFGIIFIFILIPLTVFAGELVVKDNAFEMNVEGKVYKGKNPILNVDSKTYLPLRELSELFGKEITYKDNTIFINTDYPESSGKGENKKYKIKSSTYPDAQQSNAKIMIGEQEYKSSNPVIIVNGSTYLSLRELANIFNEPINFKEGVIYVKGEVSEEAQDEDKPEFTVIEELILKPDGTLWVQGDNKDGRLSKGTKDTYISQPIKLMDGVKQIDYGGIYGCGGPNGYYDKEINTYFIVKEDNTLWRIGEKLEKLMDGVAKVNRNTIITVDGDLYIHEFRDMELGNYGSGILDLLGAKITDFRKWNDPYAFQPVKVPGVSGVKDAMYTFEIEGHSSGNARGNQAEVLLILKNDHTLWGCGKHSGANVGEEWGHLDEVELIMENVKSLVNVGVVNAIIKRDNSLWAWGGSTYGAFARDYEDIAQKPIKLLDKVRSAHVESFKCLAVTTNNDLYTWGYSQFDAYYDQEELGIYKIASNIEKVIPSTFHFVALKTNGTVWMYGEDLGAEIEESYDEQGNYIVEDKDMIGGFGTADVRKNIGYYKFHSAEPFKDAIDIGIGRGNGALTYALRPDGKVWVWGINLVLPGDKEEELTEEDIKRTRVPRPFIVQ